MFLTFSSFEKLSVMTKKRLSVNEENVRNIFFVYATKKNERFGTFLLFLRFIPHILAS